MKAKRISVLAIAYIAILAVIFHFLYHEMLVTDIALVIAVIGVFLALITELIIKRINKGRDSDEKKD